MEFSASAHNFDFSDFSQDVVEDVGMLKSREFGENDLVKSKKVKFSSACQLFEQMKNCSKSSLKLEMINAWLNQFYTPSAGHFDVYFFVRLLLPQLDRQR